MGNCVYHVAHQGLRAAWKQIGRNQEMPNYTQALYEARELAMERMQTEADELQAGGIVGARISESSHGWGSHVIEFFAIGTAVVPTSADHQIEQPALVLPLTGIGPAGSSRRDARRRAQAAGLQGPAAEGVLRPLPRARALDEPEPVYEAVRVVTVLNALIAFRARGYGSENVPNGPVILAPNHASFMDHFFTGAFIRRRVQFMGKSQLFKRRR